MSRDWMEGKTLKEKLVLVVDDDPGWAESMRKRVAFATESEGESLRLASLSDSDLKLAIGILIKRQQGFRKHPKTNPTFGDCVFDDADIVVIDYDLGALFGTEALMTGELLASLVRKYSSGGPILSVNRFGPRRFDLIQEGHTRSWADLSVSHEDLRDSGLWTHVWKAYRPWSWPVFLDFPEKFEQRVEYCAENYERKITNLLRIPPSVAKVLPRRATDAVGNLPEVTARQLVDNRLPPKDRGIPKALGARLAASEIGKWLEEFVLPGQDILIDPPHLGSLFPSVLRMDPLTRRKLDELASLQTDAKLPMRQETIAESEFQLPFFLSRKSWWTDLVLTNEHLREVSAPWERRTLPYVFAEDTSRFEDPDRCSSYRMDGLASPRWVRRPDSSIPYEPPNRLAA